MLSPDNSESHDEARRRKPTPDEEARRRAAWSEGAESQEDWDDELRLNQLLRRVPDAPISSNFTARVMSRVDREAQAAARHPWRTRWESFANAFLSVGWAPRLAIGAGVVLFSFFSFYQYRISAREEVARSVAAVSSVAAWPSLDVLMNFEAIQRLPQIPKDGKVDVELLAALK